ncbi:hypothetical protein DQW77_16060 [Roseovarius sp. TE539]|uniref:hypothetical protein n=1 Tax=Roseovarius sp. TE539 TaxID=2249812 RepID=UPI000DE1739F|nr:hypothetical protein [Roseovarius sp. TE539]RBI68990.1 hypothetical protein DQW77_16060 [Roseovarius sp. TE539]
MTRDELRQACLARLDERAEEHPCGHQGKLAARYVLHGRTAGAVELMFEKGPRSAPNLWVAEWFVDHLVAEGSLEFRHAPSSAVFATRGANGKRQYGRHSALKVMNQLSDADLVCFRINTLGDLDRILDHLSMRGTSSA